MSMNVIKSQLKRLFDCNVGVDIPKATLSLKTIVGVFRLNVEQDNLEQQ